MKTKPMQIRSRFRSPVQFTQRTKRFSQSRGALVLDIAITVLALAFNPASAQNSYFQHNLASDLPGVADFTDSNLVNPWGIAFSASGPFWISDNRTGLSTIYNGS